MRIATLAEVADRCLEGATFDHCLADFLDGFYRAPAAEPLSKEPLLLAPRFGEAGRVQDAYLAAVGEELARRFALPQPTWAGGDTRRLRRPWFAMPMAAVRAVLILESPAPFRSRNLFVSENALSRA